MGYAIDSENIGGLKEWLEQAEHYVPRAQQFVEEVRGTVEEFKTPAVRESELPITPLVSPMTFDVGKIAVPIAIACIVIIAYLLLRK